MAIRLDPPFLILIFISLPIVSVLDIGSLLGDGTFPKPGPFSWEHAAGSSEAGLSEDAWLCLWSQLPAASASVHPQPRHRDRSGLLAMLAGEKPCPAQAIPLRPSLQPASTPSGTASLLGPKLGVHGWKSGAHTSSLQGPLILLVFTFLSEKTQCFPQ